MAGGEEPPALFSQLQELFGDRESLSTGPSGRSTPSIPLGAPSATSLSATSSVAASSGGESIAPAEHGHQHANQQARERDLFMKRHSLDALFEEAVDRAMLHNVPSPVQFVAQ